MTDEEAIRRTLAEYCQLLDDGQFDAWSEIFTVDAVFMPPGDTCTGREEIRAWPYAYFPGAKGMGRHLTMNETIDINGHTAQVRADVLVVLPSPEGPRPALIGEYYDTLVRGDGRWLFNRREVVTQSQNWLSPVLGATATGPLGSR